MFKIILIILLAILIIALTFYYLKIYNKENKGHSRVRMKMQEKKEMNKDKIMRLFKKKERVQGQDVQSALLIEELETWEYLKELEKDGKIKKMGEGKNIYYVKTKEENKK